jgi:hypothetical protein
MESAGFEGGPMLGALLLARGRPLVLTVHGMPRTGGTICPSRSGMPAHSVSRPLGRCVPLLSFPKGSGAENDPRTTYRAFTGPAGLDSAALMSALGTE